MTYPRGSHPDHASWPWRRYRHLVLWPTTVVGLLAVALTLWQAAPVYVWALLIIFFVVLGALAHADRATEGHLIVIGASMGLPLGLALGIARAVVSPDTDALLDLVRFPVLTALLGIVITATTGFIHRHRVTTKHLFLGDHPAPKRHA